MSEVFRESLKRSEIWLGRVRGYLWGDQLKYIDAKASILKLCFNVFLPEFGIKNFFDAKIANFPEFSAFLQLEI
jgi:hypothetical protein